MQQHTGLVMPGSIQPEELKIQQVRQPSEWMPVGNVKASKGPQNTLPSESGPDVEILCDVGVIVVIGKPVASDRQIYQQRCRSQGQRKQQGNLSCLGVWFPFRAGSCRGLRDRQSLHDPSRD